MNHTRKPGKPFFQIPRAARATIGFLAAVFLLLGVSTLATGQFAMSRTVSRATGTTAVVMGVAFVVIGLILLTAAFLAQEK